jgi:regulator of replication initiation timing
MPDPVATLADRVAALEKEADSLRTANASLTSENELLRGQNASLLRDILTMKEQRDEAVRKGDAALKLVRESAQHSLDAIKVFYPNPMLLAAPEATATPAEEHKTEAQVA